MKTNSTITSKIIIVALLMLTCNLVFGSRIKSGKKSSKKEREACLQISGSVNIDTRIASTYTVELVLNGKVLDSAIVRDNGTFRFNLTKDAHYGIRITKYGFLPRLISVNTNLPEDENHTKGYKLHFDTELIAEHEKPSLDHDALDFPIALISFDKEGGWFYFDEDYTTDIKRKIYSKELASNN